MPSVCMWFLFVVLNASLVCILVRILSNVRLVHAWLVTIKRSIKQPLNGDQENLCYFLPDLANDGGHWTIWNYVSILLCENKYRYCGLWWMERVSQISVTSTLKTFPKWPYKEFLKRCLLRIKRSNWWKTERVMNLNCAQSFNFSFTSFYFGFWNMREP